MNRIAAKRLLAVAKEILADDLAEFVAKRVVRYIHDELPEARLNVSVKNDAVQGLYISFFGYRYFLRIEGDTAVITSTAGDVVAKGPVHGRIPDTILDALADDAGVDLTEYIGNDDEYESGSTIDVEVGDLVDAGAYGRLWITGTGVVGDLWTSEDKDDVETGRGRGLRFSYVRAIKKEGSGPWIKVKWNRDEEYYEVVR